MTKIMYLLIVGLLFTLYYKVYNQNIKVVDIDKQQSSVIIYSKTMCLYCIKAKDLLKNKNIAYREVNLGEDILLHQKLIEETNQTTVPYIFINGKFIGGYTELQNLEDTKNLDLMINTSNIEAVEATIQ